MTLESDSRFGSDRCQCLQADYHDVEVNQTELQLVLARTELLLSAERNLADD